MEVYMLKGSSHYVAGSVRLFADILRVNTKVFFPLIRAV